MPQRKRPVKQAELDLDDGRARPPLSEKDTIKALHDHFNARRASYGARALRLTSERVAKYRARLRTFSPSDILRAIDAALASPFYRGEDPKTNGARYDYPETVLKTDAAVDRHLDAASRPMADPNRRGREIYERTLRLGRGAK